MEELRVELERKWLFLDTNVLLKAARNPEAFLPILKVIQGAGCQPAYCQMIRAEVLQSVWQPELIAALEQFLKDLNIVDVGMTPLDKLTDDVMDITRWLRARKKPLPDLVDSYAIALVKKYSKNMILVTENHKDYAYTLKRFYVHPIELNEQDIVTLGFYKTP